LELFNSQKNYRFMPVVLTLPPPRRIEAKGNFTLARTVVNKKSQRTRFVNED
jgi:hypothetical protein